MKLVSLLMAVACLLASCAQQPTQSSLAQTALSPAADVMHKQSDKQVSAALCSTSNTAKAAPLISKTAFRLSVVMDQHSVIGPSDMADYSDVVFNRYLNALDEKHAYLLSADIESFKPYRNTLWSDLKRGEVGSGYCIFNRYQERVEETLSTTIAYLENALIEQDLQGEQVFRLRGEAIDRFLTVAGRAEYWQQKAKHEVLLKMTNGVSFEAAKRQLIIRYQAQRNRVAQTSVDDIFETYANAFLTVLDGHSTYFAPQVSKNFSIDKSLKLEGIGLVLQAADEGALVVSALDDGPSDGKLKPGDVILSIATNGVDFEAVAGWRLDDIVERIRGPKGSYVGLEIKPVSQKGKLVRLSVMRDAVVLKDRVVESDVISIHRNGKDYAIGVVHIPAFYADLNALKKNDPNARTTTRELEALILKLKQQDISGLIIDLTQNGGGALVEANNVASLFIADRPTFMVATKSQTETMVGRGRERLYSGPVVVLVNDRSAGAAEIVAAVLQDYGVGMVVGQRTFGMGSVTSLQQLIREPAAYVKITMAEYIRVTGKPFLGIGVTPDIDLPTSTLPRRETNSAMNTGISYPPKNIDTITDLTEVRAALQKRSAARQVKDPAFTYIRKSYEHNRSMVLNTTYPLNLVGLQALSDEANQTAQRLLEEYQKTNAVAEEASIQERAWLAESAEIIVDWIETVAGRQD